jgi:LysR substrate binding domain
VRKERIAECLPVVPWARIPQAPDPRLVGLSLPASVDRVVLFAFPILDTTDHFLDGEAERTQLHGGLSRPITTWPQTVAIGYVFGPMPAATIMGHRVCIVDLVVAVPTCWAGRVQQASWEDLAALPWIVADEYCPFQDLVEQRFAQRCLDYQRVMQASDEATKLELVSAGVGLTTSLLPQ